MRRAVIGVIVVTAGTGCRPVNHDDDEWKTVRTEHLTVIDRTDDVICAGVAPLLDREFVRVSNEQGLSIPTAIPITVELGEAAVEARCGFEAEGEIVGGCVGVGNGEIGVATRVGVASHELVHATRHANGVFGNRFFEEGLAEALHGGERSPYLIGDDAASDSVSPASAIESFETSTRFYITAGHFVSWMLADYERSTVINAMTSASYAAASDDESLREWFEVSFGESLEAAEARWRDESTIRYWQPGPCEEPLDFAGELEIEGALDCDAEDTIGALLDGGVTSLPTCVRFEPGAMVLLALEASSDVELLGSRIHADGFPEYFEVAGGEQTVLNLSDPFLLVSARTLSAEPRSYVVRFLDYE